MKRKFATLVVLLNAAFWCFSQTKAVTEKGDEVLLYPDGTWKYVDNKKETQSKKIDTIVTTKSLNARFLVKSEKVNCGVWLDPKKWKFNKSDENEESELSFTLAGQDAYGMLISERIEIPLESLKEIALANGKEVSSDLEIVKEQIRKVNGVQMLCLQMNGTIQGVKFTYFGYYWSSEKGTVQFITYTSQNLFTKYKPDLEELLNGFVETNHQD
jgi:hypothetical protein